MYNLYLYLIACLKTDCILFFLLIVQYEADKLKEKESYANPGMSPSRNTSRYKIHAVYMVYRLSVRSRFLYISQVLFLHVYGPRWSQGWSMNSQKRTRPIPSHLDRKGLVNKGFIIWKKGNIFVWDTVSKITPSCPFG